MLDSQYLPSASGTTLETYRLLTRGRVNSTKVDYRIYPLEHEPKPPTYPRTNNAYLNIVLPVKYHGNCDLSGSFGSTVRELDVKGAIGNSKYCRF